jgi:hypothetical protein
MQTELKFPHRFNPDGTFDSICITCFRTIAMSEKEADLAAAEEAHACNPADLPKNKYRDLWKPGA